MGDYERRLEAATRELEMAGIGKSRAFPLWVRFCKAIGLNMRPPHYDGFIRSALSNGAAFAVFWGIGMYFLRWSDHGPLVKDMLGVSLGAGILFGLCLAGFYKIDRRKHALSDWRSL